MELSILNARGLPEGGILSVRSGPTRRQSPLPCVAPFRLPAGPWPLRIDVMALLGKSQPGTSLEKLGPDGLCRVPLEAQDGRQMSVTLQVTDGKSGPRPKTAPALSGHKDIDEPEAEVSPNSPLRRRDTEAEARAYLDRHRLHEFMHALFELLLRERPEDPYFFMAARFREAAMLEPKNVAEVPSVYSPHKALSPSLGKQVPSTPDAFRSNVSTAPSVHREISTPLVPDGSFRVNIRTMRGRSLSNMVMAPRETVGALKQRLEATLNVPASSQQLFFWAEALPNDSTLEDHFIPASPPPTLNLVCSAKDTRLKTALSGSSEGGLRIWNLETNALTREFSEPGIATLAVAVAVHWESMRAITGMFNGDLKLWDLAEGKCSSTLKGHTDEVSTIEVDWAKMMTVTGSGDRKAKLWNLSEKQCVVTYDGDSYIFVVAVDWTKKMIFAGMQSGNVRVWDMDSGTLIATRKHGAELPDAEMSAIAIDPHQGRAVSGFLAGHMVYWHFGALTSDSESTEKPSLPVRKAVVAHYSPIRTIVARWTTRDSRALCGSDDGTLSLWRLESHECMARFSRHIGMVWTVFADWSLDRVLSGAFDGCMKIWDLRTGECLRTFQGHSRPLRIVSGL